MSLASNTVKALRSEGAYSDNPLSLKLQSIRDKVERFNEFDCASQDCALGRYSSMDTLGVLKRFKALVEGVLSSK
jgi:hypothetical protein